MGKPIWGKVLGKVTSYGGSGNVRLLFDASGDLLAVTDTPSLPIGFSLAKFDSTGALLWNKILPQNTLPQNTLGLDPCGNALVAGVLWKGTTDLGAGPLTGGMFIAKLAP